MSKKKFENEKVFLSEIPEFERIETNKLEKEYLKVIYANLFIVFSLSSIALLISILSFEMINEGYIFSIGLAFYFLIWLLILIYYLASFKKRSYSFREHDVVYKYGVIYQTAVLIPFNRIQHIALHQGIFSRMYGLASLQFYTAGGSTTDINIKGLKLETAQKFKNFVSEKIEKIDKN
tara:strand:+ start:136 stop:669 length:534 start_codon:yes stop_codon:yes gene_type:complete